MSEQEKIKLNQMLKEYEFLRNEITQIGNIATQIFSGFLALIGVMSGFAFSVGVMPQQLIVIILIISVLALIGLWFTFSRHHNVLITAIYIRLVLEKQLEGLNWENTLYILRQNNVRIPRLLTSFRITYGFVTFVGAIFVIIFEIQQNRWDTSSIVSVLISIILLSILIVLFVYQQNMLTATEITRIEKLLSPSDTSD